MEFIFDQIEVKTNLFNSSANRRETVFFSGLFLDLLYVQWKQVSIC